ncbi:hypothetical protein MKEN_00576700 [Mycena kentingensis (nom. inval.)]|nr:hypothetical protein MKEN_00576700 [Mycena kentingensis (nom. inval.)]
MAPTTLAPALDKAHTRLDDIATKLGAIVHTIDVLSDGLKAPFLEPMTLTMRFILSGVQSIRSNKAECIALLETVHQILCAVVAVNVTPQNANPRPWTLSSLLRWGILLSTVTTVALQKVSSLLETQRETSRIKRFFKQTEAATMLKACQDDLQRILNALKVRFAGLVHTIREVETDFASAHEKVLDLVQAGADSESYTTGAFSASSGSRASLLSVMPANPQIFHGRDAELTHIIDILTGNINPALVILGPGGMGKTSLAHAALHHAEVQAKYPPECCIYARCDAAITAEDILVNVAKSLGLEPGRNLRPAISSYLASRPPHLLVLDNLETVWEPSDTRGEVESILAFFAGLTNLALLVTMRGAERPAEVAWTRPFLPPLEPLHLGAARQTLFDIADELNLAEPDVATILALTDNIPLAITLVAHLVESEGTADVLSRWEAQKTTMLSDGFDRHANLDVSIALSLESPRLRADPAACKLLQILSVLPDGLAERDLTTALPLDNPLGGRSTLLRISLAYHTPAKRLTLLVPIREYIRKYEAPPIDLIRPISRQYTILLELFDRSFGIAPIGNLRDLASTNFANFQSLLAYRLDLPEPDDLAETAQLAIMASRYRRREGWENAFLAGTMARLSSMLRRHPGHELLEVALVGELLWNQYRSSDPDLLDHAISLFPRFDDLKVKCDLYGAASYHAMVCHGQLSLAESWLDKSLAISVPETRPRADALRRRARLYIQRGNFVKAAELAETAQRFFRQSGDLFGEASALLATAEAFYGLGAYADAAEAAKQGRTLVSMYDFAGTHLDSVLLNLLGEIHRSKSEYREAKAAYDEALRLVAPDRTKSGTSLYYIQLNLVEIEMALNGPDHPAVQARLDSVYDIARGMSLKLVLLMCEATEGMLRLYQGVSADGTSKLRRCFVQGEAEVKSFCAEHLANPALRGGDEWAYIFLAHLSSGAGAFQQKVALLRALQFIGQSMLIDGDRAAAKNLLLVALEGFKARGIHRGIAECCVALAEISETAGHAQKALELLDEAGRRFARSGLKKQVENVRRWTARVDGRFDIAIRS